MASNTQNIISAFAIPAGNTLNVDIHLGREGLKKLAFLFEVIYQATASTTGLSCDIIPGYGGADPATVIGAAPYYLALPAIIGAVGATPAAATGATVPKFSDNKYAVTMATMTPSSVTSVTKRTHGYLNDILRVYPEWARFQFTNLDATNGCTLTFKASIGNDV